MAAFDFNGVVDTTNAILSEDTFREWKRLDLVKEVMLRSGATNKIRVNTVISTMVAAGVAKGWIARGNANSISYKSPSDISVEAYKNLQDRINQLQAEIQSSQATVEAVKQEAALQVEKVREEALKSQSAVYEIKVVSLKNGKTLNKIDSDTYHPIFREVVDLALARQHIFVPGPAGCGKSHLAKQVADALKLRFGFISCSAGMSESQLLGRMIPAGENGSMVFQTTQFLECYENGGLFLFDEIDAADANVLLVINAALANGHLSVPSRHGSPVAKRHPDFVCVAAANTFGTGADRQYVGRNQLDESTLDRFRIGTVPMDYDESLERTLVKAELNGSGEAFYSRMLRYRANMRKHRLPRVLSTRFIIQAARMMRPREDGGCSWDDAKVDEKLFAAWRPDEITKVKSL